MPAPGGPAGRLAVRGARFALACAVLFVAALAWNGVLHLVVLRGAEAELARLYRPDLADRMGLALLVTAAIAVIFVLGYSGFARTGTLGEGARYGVFFALVAGVLADLNQWVLYPIPGRLALAWFAGGVAEFVLYGILAARIGVVSDGGAVARPGAPLPSPGGRISP